MSALFQKKDAQTPQSAECVAEKEINESSEKDTAVISYPRKPLREREDPRACYARLDRLAYCRRVLQGARICALWEMRQTERELFAIIDKEQAEQQKTANKPLTAKEKKRIMENEEKRMRLAQKKIEKIALLKKTLSNCRTSRVAMGDETARIAIHVSAVLAETVPTKEEKRLPRYMQLMALRARAERGINRTARKYNALERVLEGGSAGRPPKTEKKIRRELIKGESLLREQKLFLKRLNAVIAASGKGR